MASTATAFLSKPHGEPERAVHPQPEGLGTQFLVTRRERRRHEGAQAGNADDEPDPAEGQLVGLLRVHPSEEEPEEESVHVSRLLLVLAGGDEVLGVFLEGTDADVTVVEGVDALDGGGERLHRRQTGDAARHGGGADLVPVEAGRRCRTGC